MLFWQQTSSPPQLNPPPGRMTMLDQACTQRPICNNHGTAHASCVRRPRPVLHLLIKCAHIPQPSGPSASTCSRKCAHSLQPSWPSAGTCLRKCAHCLQPLGACLLQQRHCNCELAVGLPVSGPPAVSVDRQRHLCSHAEC
jgi:hypothetical protein